MKTEQTLIFTKPMPHFNLDEEWLLLQIKMRALKAGLAIDTHITVTLEDGMLDRIYPDLSPGLKIATRQHLSNQVVHVVVFGGNNAIRLIRTIVGEHFDPKECASGSLRHELWRVNRGLYSSSENGEILPANERYYYNFIHCTRNEEEFKEQYPFLCQ